MKLSIQPLGDRFLIKEGLAEEKTRGGIIIADTAKGNLLKGTILAVGISIPNNSTPLKIGDSVLYRKDSGIKIHMEGIVSLLVNESDIYAIIQDHNQ
ncbi:GroES family chaperonin [Membranihabitans maritimus]|uniref:GroES family chaperonin n=1 Tax=Membranihabitans maritimus TaxID=2904244 RepID=UPI001F1632D1|nr:co-chaperone GroES [Membranihabitans maritimus]